MHRSFLTYRGFLFLKVAGLAGILAVALYMGHAPMDAPNGGTWLGYGLGTVSVFLIFWLAWFGVRKRRYSGVKPLRGWLSAHVYLGSALLVLATLHTGFQFGWNVHTLAYGLMLLVIASGIFGTVAYARLPRLVADNRGRRTLEAMVAEISSLDREARQAAMALDDKVNAMVFAASEKLQLGGSLWRILSGREPACRTSACIAHLESLPTKGGIGPEEGAILGTLVRLLYRKRELLHRARLDLRYQALLDIWLHIHIPATVLLIVALVAHVVAVFFFW
ncbi:MAG: hypothetical protein FJX60_00335 [Alphaproteobacteria bacterium]|nr:hypothetical protein [Alphaproteobacteria bacterium]